MNCRIEIQLFFVDAYLCIEDLHIDVHNGDSQLNFGVNLNVGMELSSV